jgi:leucyl/phenylalanyl-tRNA--protein transferase
MPIVRLGRQPEFPPPEMAEREGVLAMGGRLDVPWLLAAYRRGIFPWYDRPPILWWSPDPRLVLFPEEVHVSRRLARTIRSGRFETRVDTAFREVMKGCAAIPRRHEIGTWINADILRAYGELHDAGYAHSVESWRDGRLVGGIYGVRIGGAFFGESMFARESDASKVALVALANECRTRGIGLIDCQVTSEHMLRMGAREIRRAEFQARIKTLVELPIGPGRWDGG